MIDVKNSPISLPLRQRPGFHETPVDGLSRDIAVLTRKHNLHGAVMICFGDGRVGVGTSGEGEFAGVVDRLGELILAAIDDGKFNAALSDSMVRRACNSHDELLAALNGLRSQGNCWCDTGDGNPHTPECLGATRAFAKAEGRL